LRGTGPNKKDLRKQWFCYMNEDTQNNTCDQVEKDQLWYDGYIAASPPDPKKKKQLPLHIDDHQKRAGHPPSSEATEREPSEDIRTARISQDLKSRVEGWPQERISDLNHSSPAGFASSSDARPDSMVSGGFNVEEMKHKKQRMHQQQGITDKKAKRVKSEDSIRNAADSNGAGSRDLFIGQHVYCVWPKTGDCYCYPGKIDAIHSKKNPIKYDILFDDGDKRYSVKESDIFLTRLDVLVAGLSA